MRRERATAAAFGDEPSRDIEAAFGALARVSTTAKPAVSVQAPKLSVAATPPKAAAPVKAPLATAAAGLKATPTRSTSVAVASPAKSGKAPAAKATVAKPTSSYPTAANQANFIDGGSAPLAAPAVKAPERTAAQVAADQRKVDAAARARLKAQTLATAERNVPALNQKRTDTYETMKAGGVFDNVRQPWEKAGIDTGQIVMGAKVIAVGASVIASGGAVAGAVGLTASGAALGSAVAADRLVAAVEKGSELGKEASRVIDDVKAAADRGDAAARTALATIESVAEARVAAAIPPGVPQTLSAAGAAAADALGNVALNVSGAGALNVGALSAQLSAAAGKAPATSKPNPYAAAAVLQRPAAPVIASGQTASGLLSSIRLERPPRWLVTPEARVVDLELAPGKATARGYLVTPGERVQKQ